LHSVIARVGAAWTHHTGNAVALGVFLYCNLALLAHGSQFGLGRVADTTPVATKRKELALSQVFVGRLVRVTAWAFGHVTPNAGPTRVAGALVLGAITLTVARARFADARAAGHFAERSPVPFLKITVALEIVAFALNLTIS
jgi:hypothetical protein